MQCFQQLERLCEKTLFEDIIPFWVRHSLDKEFGGYFTCLDRKGNIYDTDKFVWLQARQIWMFSKLYNAVRAEPDWLGIARLGAEFLRRHGMDARGNFYFALDRAGRPLVQPYNIFSDCFSAMAFSEYGSASKEEWAAELAMRTFRNIQSRKGNPKGKYSKAYPGTRPLLSLALPMITLGISLEMNNHLSEPLLNEVIGENLEIVMNKMVDTELGLIFENVSSDGSHPDTFEGRLINPGHGIEAMWFVMAAARELKETRLIKTAAEVMLRQLEFGWDKDFGGIFYFLDSKGKPPLQLEWDQKLWWVHIEAMVALALAYELTGEERYLKWYDKVHEYTWKHFPDPEYGEWWGYLTREGKVNLPLKGGKWKGCFHLPRALHILSDIFKRLSNRNARSI